MKDCMFGCFREPKRYKSKPKHSIFYHHEFTTAQTSYINLQEPLLISSKLHYGSKSPLLTHKSYYPIFLPFSHHRPMDIQKYIRVSFTMSISSLEFASLCVLSNSFFITISSLPIIHYNKWVLIESFPRHIFIHVT